MSELAELAAARAPSGGGSGLSVAKVSSNVDSAGLGRVQVKLPWNPGAALWARVAVPMAGDGSGSWWLPQEGDEVLVAFNQNDLSEAYVVGCLWSGGRRPPTAVAQDASGQRLLRTPAGQELLFDDRQNLVRVTTAGGQQLLLGADRVELTNGQGTTLTLSAQGEITLQAAQRISLQAPQVSIRADARLELGAGATALLDGGGLCEVKAALVEIN